MKRGEVRCKVKACVQSEPTSTHLKMCQQCHERYWLLPVTPVLSLELCGIDTERRYQPTYYVDRVDDRVVIRLLLKLGIGSFSRANSRWTCGIRSLEPPSLAAKIIAYAVIIAQNSVQNITKVSETLYLSHKI